MDGAAGPLKPLEQQLYPLLGQTLGILPDGGQPGDGELGQGDAVVPHHGHVLRHLPAQVPDGPDDALVGQGKGIARMAPMAITSLMQNRAVSSGHRASRRLVVS